MGACDDGGMRIAVVVLSALLLAACGPSAPDPKVEAKLVEFERQSDITPASWDGAVTGREVRNGGLFVDTKLGTSDVAREVAGGICGTYAQYWLVDESVGVVRVRAGSGDLLAKCGPKA